MKGLQVEIFYNFKYWDLVSYLKDLIDWKQIGSLERVRQKKNFDEGLTIGIEQFWIYYLIPPLVLSDHIGHTTRAAR